jgi:hypothetical protein
MKTFMKDTILRLIATATSAMLMVLVLYYAGDKTNQVSGGFTRTFLPYKLNKIEEYNLDSRHYYIITLIKGKIYLGNGRNPQHVKILENSVWQFKTIDMAGNAIHASSILIDSGDFYIKDLVNYVVYSGSLQDWKVSRIAFDSVLFSEAELISPRSIIRRTIKPGKYEYVLAKETGKDETINNSLLEKQIDGLFCTDGMLHADPASNRITYVYFYRNEFLCADTSLNLLFKAHTIDTISRARIKVAEVFSDNSIKLSTPPFIVNSKSYVDGNKLYINSNIISDSESTEDFKNSSVIDVYDLELHGTYKHSFYIPFFNKKKVRTLAIENDLLVAIYDEYLVTYRMKN